MNCNVVHFSYFFPTSCFNWPRLPIEFKAFIPLLWKDSSDDSSLCPFRIDKNFRERSVKTAINVWNADKADDTREHVKPVVRHNKVR